MSERRRVDWGVGGRPDRLHQSAPFPQELEEVVECCSYKPGWSLSLTVAGGGLSLLVTMEVPDCDPPHSLKRIPNVIPVPPKTYSREGWTEWVFEQLLRIEQHEAAEHFRVEGQRAFPPSHGSERDAYLVRFGSVAEW